jgi:hypothetical protein
MSYGIKEDRNVEEEMQADGMSACGPNAKYENVCFCAALSVYADVTRTSLKDRL